MNQRHSFLILPLLVALLAFSACTQPTTPTTPTKETYQVIGSFAPTATNGGAVVVMSGSSPVMDATVTINGNPTVCFFGAYLVDGGITVASGDTVTINVVKGTFATTGSVVIPDEFVLNPTAATPGSSYPVTLTWSGLSPAPQAMTAIVEGSQLASGTDWTYSTVAPGTTGNILVADLGSAISPNTFYTVTVSAQNVTMLDGAAGSMLIGSTEQTCDITTN